MVRGTLASSAASTRNRFRQSLYAASLASITLGASPACGRLGLAHYRSVTGDGDAAVDSPPAPVPTGDASAAPADANTAPEVGPPPAEARAPDANERDSGPPPPPDATPDSGPLADASHDARDARPMPPDCRCPSDDYFIDVDVNGTSFRLVSAYHLALYCDETAPQLAHPPCGSVYRLSGCASGNDRPPCLYLTVDGQSPVIGLFVDSTGQTFSLVTGQVTVKATFGRVATGEFSAIYASQSSEAQVQVTGTFGVCTTLFEPCRT